MVTDLFAGIPVADYDRSTAWYERLFGAEPSFLPNDIEAVWEVAEHRYVYIEVRPDHAGSARHMLFVDDLDTRVAALAAVGLAAAETETYGNGVRKVTYRDPDGNQFALGGAPPEG